MNKNAETSNEGGGISRGNGGNFVNISTLSVDADSTQKRKKPVKSKLLIVGNGIIGVLAPVIDVIALSFTAQSIVVPIGGFTIIWNFILSAAVLKETYDSQDVLGNVSIVAGTALITIAGNHDSAVFTLPVLTCLFKNELFVYYFGSLLMVVCILGVTSMYDMMGGHRWAMVACCALPGFFGGQHYFIKSTSELLRLAVFQNQTYFGDAAAYCISIMGIGLAVAQLSLLNVAFSRYDSLVVHALYSRLRPRPLS